MRNSKIRQALAELKLVLDREAREIRSRNLSRLAEFVLRKDELAAACEEMIADVAFGPQSTIVLRELSAVQEKAKRNAADLLAVKQGFVDARLRLEALLKSESRTGLYSPAGGEIRSAAPSALRRDV
ncbi:MAG: hypothetical protein HXY21_13995 [Parvularculaceae bacterium]|nr:hypothetical protein [Parvularculaceae bacterium]